MTQVTLAVLAFSCAVLCVGVAGLLRRVTDVKLALSGHSGEHRQFMIDIGRQLPKEVIAEIPEPEEDALLIVGSTSCETCKIVLAELDAVPGQVVAGVIQDGADDELIELGRCSALLSTATTELLVREFDLSQVPVAIAQRDGYVTGAAYGAQIGTGEGLREFWAMFGAFAPVEVVA
jgi:hypothetical protein